MRVPQAIKPDIALAAFIALASLIVAVVSYAAIGELERHAITLVDNVPPGSTNYSVIANKSCIGDLMVSVTDDEILAIVSRGTIRAAVHAQPIDISYSTRTFFNPLKQLSNGVATLDINGRSITINATGAHPIRITTKSEGFPLSLAGEFSVTGPISITRKGDGGFRIERIAQGDNAPALPADLISSLLSEITLEIVPTNSPNDWCASKSAARVDLSPVAQRLTQLSDSKLSTLRGLLPL